MQIDKNSIPFIQIDDIPTPFLHHQKEIYRFLGIESDFNEEKRKSFFSQTASIRQIGADVHSKSIEKKEFLDHKNEFYDALLMQSPELIASMFSEMDVWALADFADPNADIAVPDSIRELKKKHQNRFPKLPKN